MVLAPWIAIARNDAAKILLIYHTYTGIDSNFRRGENVARRDWHRGCEHQYSSADI